MAFLTRLLPVLGLLLFVLGGPGIALAGDIQEDILNQTAILRGLQPKASVPFAFVDAAYLRQDLLKSYNNPDAIRDLEVSRKLLVLLGLLSPDADLHGMLVDLYAENVVGYYNHDDKKMYVVSGQTTFGPEEKVTLAHEFTHALQDQYFDLHKVEAGTEDNGDYSLAVEALIEGDATLTMVLYARTYLSPEELFQLQNSEASSSLDRVPLVVRDEVEFPYNEGALFALRLFQSGGYDAVNAAFRDPPKSTEQIIHPGKYLAHEQPIQVTLPDLAGALGPGWTQLRSDVLGELDVRILLEQFLDPNVAAKGAEGWGGDRFALLEDATGRDAVVVSTVWDSEAEAGEFFNDYADTVSRRYGQRASRVTDVPSKIAWATPNGSMLLEKWGPRVAIIIAPDERVMNTLLATIASAAGQPLPAQAPGPAPAPVQVPR
jgi:heme-degrading monooxygenase HmoA